MAKDSVTIKVHRNFFDKVFEPNRKKLAKQIGLIDISQTKFTQFLATKNDPLGINSMFKKSRRKGLGIRF